MNKYYEWKVLTCEGRLIKVPSEKSERYDQELTGTFSCEEEALEVLNEWLELCQCTVPENLTLVTFYN